MSAPPLWRNRDFLLLQVGFLLSSAGSQISAIAYPLLVLALTGSAAKAGLVGFAGLVPLALFALPAGLAADRWNRRRVMLGAHAVRMVAIATLGSMILLDRVVFWAIPVIAFVQGAGNIVFSVTSAGALRSVVAPRQLPAAAAVVTGRDAAVTLAGPPLGGALFAIGRAVPFLVHAASYVFATLALLAIRTPFQEQRERDDSPVRVRLAQGFRFVWDHPFIRTCAFLYGLSNFIGPGVLLAIVVIGREEGLSGGEVGVLLGVFSGCILAGSFLSPLVRRVLPVRGVVLLELWAWPGCALFLIWPNVYVLTASLLPTALAISSTNSVVDGYQLAMTPDRLVGRVESVRSTISLCIAPLGPLVAGVLLDAVSARATIAVFAAFALALAVWGTLSPSIRDAPRLDELVPETPAPGAAPGLLGSELQHLPAAAGRDHDRR